MSATLPRPLPTVSVIMTTYNGSALIGESIRSILQQSWTDLELIVVDDCSTDDTAALVEAIDDPRIRLVRNPRNLDIVGSRNVAFAHATGRYITALDHDDIAEADRLAQQVAFLDANPDIVLVGTAYRFFGQPTNRKDDLSPLHPLTVEWMCHCRTAILWSSMMARADRVRRLEGPLRPERVLADELDFYHRMAAHGRLARLSQPLTRYRLHGGNTTDRRNQEMRRNGALVLAEAYAPWVGARAPEIADRVIRLVTWREPPRDKADLLQLCADLAELSAAFIRKHDAPPQARAEIAATVRDYVRATMRQAIHQAGLGAVRLLPTIAAHRSFRSPSVLRTLAFALVPGGQRLRSLASQVRQSG